VKLGRPGPSAAALALAATLLGPGPALGARLDGVERETAAVESRVAQVEKLYLRPDESAAARARRQFSDGETQLLLGDWLHASVLLYGALDEAEFRASADAPPALLYLGDALSNQGSCGAALSAYEELLRRGAAGMQAAALIGTLDCRIKLKRLDGIQPLLDEAQAQLKDGLPAELAYLVGKASYFRTDLRPAERVERAMLAFAAVAPPLHVAATYFQGALQVEAGDLGAAAERFEACLKLQGNDPRQVEIRELCAMGAGRVYAEQGKFAESLDRYQLLPYTSPRFNEALYEVSWGYVRAGNHEQALRTAAMIVDLAPESQMAPEATILTGHLNLRLGRYAAASESFNKVINNYAPVRDEIDAILTMQEDPVRYLNELIGRQGKAFDVASVLPPLAAKWASAQKEVGGALDLVMALDGAGQDLADSLNVVARVEALLQRGGGLDAVPLARDGWISADAIEDGSMRLRGQIADRAAELAAPLLSLAGRKELETLRSARRKLQPRLDSLPRTNLDVESRARRMRARVNQAEKALFQLGLQVDAAGASVAGTEAWLNQHRSEIQGDQAGRDEFRAELQQQREIVTGYQEAIRALRHEIAAARDAVGGSAQAAGDGSLRSEYLALVERERALTTSVQAALPPADAGELRRGEALIDRLDRTDAAAERLKDQFAAVAARNALVVGGLLASERAELLRQREQLASITGDSKDIIGRIALHSFSAVRSQFYRLVLKADVGIIDVAWSRKRERVERIQQISQQKATALEAMDRDYKRIVPEVDPP
jgi:tetratricopeptide (TPR) repeat protein